MLEKLQMYINGEWVDSSSSETIEVMNPSNDSVLGIITAGNSDDVDRAVAAAKAGVKTYFISKIGDDQFGEMATKIYDEAKVDYSNVIISREHSTGAAAIMVNEESGANAINVFPGAAAAITNADIDKAENIIKDSKIFLTQLEAPKETVLYAIKKAHSLGVKTVLNPAPAAEIDKSVFPFIDYFTPNETEASFYVGHAVNSNDDASRAASKLLDMGIKNVIITLGEKGAYFANANETFSSPIANLSNPVVDTTGAGDAFNAGFAVALTENKSIKDAISFASATAGLSTTKIGTANSMPNRDEIDKIL